MKLFCPLCGHTLEKIQISSEPLKEKTKLGVVACICFHCKLVLHTEAITDKTPFVAVARLRKLTRGASLQSTIAVYNDLLSFLDPMVEWIKLITPQNVTEDCKHKLSSLFVYLRQFQDITTILRDETKLIYDQKQIDKPNQ